MGNKSIQGLMLKLIGSVLWLALQNGSHAHTKQPYGLGKTAHSKGCQISVGINKLCIIKDYPSVLNTKEKKL